MFLTRRRFLASAGASTAILVGFRYGANQETSEFSFAPQTYAVIPVVGDGKWIWTEPPRGETGYLEPRYFDVSTTITAEGQGRGSHLVATTVVPSAFPEQQIIGLHVEQNGCDANVAVLEDGAAVLRLFANEIVRGQVVSAVARYRMSIHKDYRGLEKDQFPFIQDPQAVFPKQLLGNSPGIKCDSIAVRTIVGDAKISSSHPWDVAKKFQQWVWDHIEGVPGKYTSVEAAIENRRGDCEERATVFVACCRAANIPARLVWVPGHTWAEIGLHDHEKRPHWIPVHTAAYSWFGWTGAHEVILQKGDNIRLPSRRRSLRLLDDWYSIRGIRPKVTFTSKIEPVALDSSDPGPGGREKLSNGVWHLTGNHPAQKFMRDK
jgi:hypothetical protein